MMGSKSREIERLKAQLASVTELARRRAEQVAARSVAADQALDEMLAARADALARASECAYLVAVVDRLTEALGWFVVVPDDVSTVDAPAVDPTCTACPHTRGRHDGWGCADCTCQVAAVHIKAEVAS